MNEYYGSLMNDFITNRYNDLSMKKLQSMKETDYKKLLLLINKIELSYSAMNTKNTKITKKSIKLYELTKEELEKDIYDTMLRIENIISNYETYSIPNKTTNINDLYYNNQITENLNKKFIKNVKEKYNSNIEFYNFDSIKNTKKTINKNISNKTDNQINHVIDEEDINNKELIMINSLYFNYQWEEEFDINQTKEEEFILDNKKEKVVNMMHTTVDTYLENEYAKGFIKNFKDNKYSFVGILPNDKNTSLSSINVEKLLATKKNDGVNIAIPRFAFDYETKLKKYFKNSNINLIFTKNSDFTNMTNEPIKLSNIYHKEYIKIGEKGTAFTSVNPSTLQSYTKDESNKELIFNRPFYFYIIDNEDETVLYVGKVVNP